MAKTTEWSVHSEKKDQPGHLPSLSKCAQWGVCTQSFMLGTVRTRQMCRLSGVFSQCTHYFDFIMLRLSYNTQCIKKTAPQDHHWALYWAYVATCNSLRTIKNSTSDLINTIAEKLKFLQTVTISCHHFTVFVPERLLFCLYCRKVQTSY